MSASNTNTNTNTSASTSSSAITVKTVFNGDSRRFVLNKPSFSDLIHQLSVYYPKSLSGDIVLKYEDDEQELITVSTDSELAEAFKVAHGGNKALKLIVSSNASSSSSAATSAATASASVSDVNNNNNNNSSKSVVSDSTPILTPSLDVHTPTPRESPVQVDSKDPPVSVPVTVSVSVPVPVPVSIESSATSQSSAASSASASASSSSTSASTSSTSTVQVTDVNEGEEDEDKAAEEEDDSDSDEDEQAKEITEVTELLGKLFGFDQSDDSKPYATATSASSCSSSLSSGCGIRSSCGSRRAAAAAAAASAQTASASDEHVWENIVCDGCNAHPLRGVRFTCTVCKDFDLCASCESRGVHPRHHPLVKTTLPPSAAKDEKAIHTHISCDGCGVKPIQGLRFKCTVCPDFDLCEQCESRRLHPADHPLLKLRMERRLPAHLPPFFRGVDVSAAATSASATADEQSRGQYFRHPFHRHPFQSFHRHPFHPFHHAFQQRPRHEHPLSGLFQHFSRPQQQPSNPCAASASASSPCSPPSSSFGRRCFGARVAGDRPCRVLFKRYVFPDSQQQPQAPAATDEKAATSASTSEPRDDKEKSTSSPVVTVKFVRDVTLPDGSSVVQGTNAVKTWQLQNTGSVTWPQGAKLIFVRGDRDVIGEVEEFPLDTIVLPGALVDVSVPLTFPTSSSSSLKPEPRRVAAYFQLADAQRNVFGPRVWVDVKVLQEEEKKVDVVDVNNTTSSVVSTPVPTPVAIPVVTSVPTPVTTPVPVAPVAPATIATVAPPTASPVAAETTVRPPSPNDWVDVQPAVSQSSAPSTSSIASSTSSSTGKFAKQLSALQQMGFENASVNSYLLEKNGGDLVATANWLIENTKQ